MSELSRQSALSAWKTYSTESGQAILTYTNGALPPYVPTPESDNDQFITVVDVESTGLGEKSEPIQVAMHKLAFSPDGDFLGWVDGYVGTREPGVEIHPEATAVHGMKLEHVKGTRFDVEQMCRLAEGSIVVAFNSMYDCPTLSRAGVPVYDWTWACAMQDIPWAEYNITRPRLELLAAMHGYLYNAHGADIDARVTALILAANPAYALYLFAAPQKAVYLLQVLGTSYSDKDSMKSLLRCTWHGELKLWYKLCESVEELSNMYHRLSTISHTGLRARTLTGADRFNSALIDQIGLEWP